MLVLGSRRRHSLGVNAANVFRFTPLRRNITLPLKTLLTRINARHVCGVSVKIMYRLMGAPDLVSLCNRHWFVGCRCACAAEELFQRFFVRCVFTKEPSRSTFHNFYQTLNNSYPEVPQCSVLLNIMNYQTQPGFYSRPGAREACGMVHSRSLGDGNEEDG